jgi:uncharacterized membrane protein
MREWVELSSEGIQALAVVVIAVSIVYGSVRFLRQGWKRVGDPYRAYKELLGHSLLLSLEFLVAADVIRTVLLDLTAKGMEILGALVVIRTFLSLSLVVELEGRWPWRASEPSDRVTTVGQSEPGKRIYARAGGLD